MSDREGLFRAERDVYTVSRLNREVRQLLEHGMPQVWIEAEISNLSRPASGHWYFSLKDRDAQVRCAMFRQKTLGLKFTPRDGTLVLARARVGLYEPRGDYQLIVEHLEEAGAGALRREFDKLKEKLDREGLFDPARKRPLPAMPRRIGVVTSPSGAAVRDILHVLKRRFPAAGVLIYPTAVQGAQAVPEILAALARAAQRRDCDVLIVARGGGSLEDLWAFNDERVARAIAAMPMPVVTGIGHEVDFTIADFVADVRAPTPTGAAQLVTPDGQVWVQNFTQYAQRLRAAIARQLRDDGLELRTLLHRLSRAHPGARVAQDMQRLDELDQRMRSALQLRVSDRAARLGSLEARLARHAPTTQLRELGLRELALRSRLNGAMQTLLQRRGQQLALAQRALHGVSPLATLARGYSIVTRAADGRVLTDVALVEAGEEIEARLGAGRLTARVTRKET